MVVKQLQFFFFFSFLHMEPDQVPPVPLVPLPLEVLP